MTLRARQDLDHDRLAHAAIELERALRRWRSRELQAERRQDLAMRLAELEQLRAGRAARRHRRRWRTDGAGPDEDVLAHALGRLEAALRARTADGV